jgi:hypothetical protein
LNYPSSWIFVLPSPQLDWIIEIIMLYFVITILILQKFGTHKTPVQESGKIRICSVSLHAPVLCSDKCYSVLGTLWLIGWNTPKNTFNVKPQTSASPCAVHLVWNSCMGYIWDGTSLHLCGLQCPCLHVGLPTIYQQ